MEDNVLLIECKKEPWIGTLTSYPRMRGTKMRGTKCGMVMRLWTNPTWMIDFMVKPWLLCHLMLSHDQLVLVGGTEMLIGDLEVPACTKAFSKTQRERKERSEDNASVLLDDMKRRREDEFQDRKRDERDSVSVKSRMI
ncbi:hypothetical protein CASFOL_018577 [Castilleja foliolosa]|uniref:Uncharacterized protein n=1 Tax=Castilleja foliolosa TaxID=1961234 RepID=A0ABD3D6E2_9LAMI